MNRIKKTSIALLACAMMVTGNSVWAADSSLGVMGDNNQILSQVKTIAGTGDFGQDNGQREQATFRIPQSVAVLVDGSLIISDSKNQLIRKLTTNMQVETAAGVTFERDEYGFPVGGFIDGIAKESLVHNPHGLAVDAEGNVYIADSDSHAIRKLDTAGKVTTLAGNGVLGNKDGLGKLASFYQPQDVVVTKNGVIYVADTLNHSIRKITSDGQVTTLNAASARTVEVTPGQAVSAGDYADGNLAQAKFNEPSGLALDAKENLYVSDSGNQRIRYIDFATNTVSTVAGHASPYGKNALYAEGDFADGLAMEASFDFPRGITVSAEGGLFIADSLNHSVRYLFDGHVVTIAGDKQQFNGKSNGVDRYALFKNPYDVALAADGSVYVADAYNNQIRKIEFYRLPENVRANETIKVVNDHNLIEFDAQPEIQNGRTMVPVRAISEALGFKVEFIESASDGTVVQLIKNDITIELYIGQQKLKKIQSGTNPVDKAIDASPYIAQERTYVPLRFFSEEMGLDVQWNNATSTAILRNR